MDITFKGNPISLKGNEIKVGDNAPDFRVLSTDLSEVTLNDYKGKTRLISVVPSIDTGVCAQQTRKFNEEANGIPGVVVMTISVDLPFAQSRWCASNGLENIHTFSDHRDLSFGEAYGVVMEELRLLARSVFVVDGNDKVTYIEYVSEGTNHPNYDKAIQATKEAAGQ